MFAKGDLTGTIKGGAGGKIRSGAAGFCHSPRKGARRGRDAAQAIAINGSPGEEAAEAGR